MPSKFGKKFDRVVKWVRGQTVRPFKLKTVHRLMIDGDRCDGCCERRGDKYIVLIDRSLRYHDAVSCLFHECAHLNDWVKNRYSGDHSAAHSDTWGIEYSRLYRDYFEWLNTVTGKR